MVVGIHHTLCLNKQDLSGEDVLRVVGISVRRLATLLSMWVIVVRCDVVGGKFFSS